MTRSLTLAVLFCALGRLRYNRRRGPFCQTEFLAPTTLKVTGVSLRILIVDDDLSMRGLLAEYFRRLGYEV